MSYYDSTPRRVSSLDRFKTVIESRIYPAECLGYSVELSKVGKPYLRICFDIDAGQGEPNRVFLIPNPNWSPGLMNANIVGFMSGDRVLMDIDELSLQAVLNAGTMRRNFSPSLQCSVKVGVKTWQGKTSNDIERVMVRKVEQEKAAEPEPQEDDVPWDDKPAATPQSTDTKPTQNGAYGTRDFNFNTNPNEKQDENPF